MLPPSVSEGERERTKKEGGREANKGREENPINVTVRFTQGAVHMHPGREERRKDGEKWRRGSGV